MANRNSLNATIMLCRNTKVNKDTTVSFNGCFDTLAVVDGSDIFDIVLNGSIDMIASGLEMYKQYYINISIFNSDRISGVEIKTIEFMITPDDLKCGRWYEFVTVVTNISSDFAKASGDYTVSAFLAPDDNFDKGEIIALKGLKVHKVKHY